MEVVGLAGRIVECLIPDLRNRQQTGFLRSYFSQAACGAGWFSGKKETTAFSISRAVAMCSG